jgi:hypothetical protein
VEQRRDLSVRRDDGGCAGELAFADAERLCERELELVGLDSPGTNGAPSPAGLLGSSIYNGSVYGSGAGLMGGSIRSGGSLFD